MSSSVPGIMGLLARKMAYLNQKEAVLAQNVANVDTPGYKQRELKEFSFGDAMKKVGTGLRVTNNKHIVPASMSGVNAQTFESKDVDILPNGNSVDLEKQMMEVSKTAMDYQTMTSVYRKMVSMFKLAAKSSGS